MRHFRILLSHIKKPLRHFAAWSTDDGVIGASRFDYPDGLAAVLPLGPDPVHLEACLRVGKGLDIRGVLPPGSQLSAMPGRPNDLYEATYLCAYPNGIKCRACGELKPTSEFMPSTKVLNHSCRDCRNDRMFASWYASPESMVQYIIWRNANLVLGVCRSTHPELDLKVGFRDAHEFLAYLKSDAKLWGTYARLCAAYMGSGRDRSLAPSLYRLDPKQGLVAGNLGFRTFKETLGQRRERWLRKPLRVEKYKYRKDGDGFCLNWTHERKRLWEAVFPNEEIAKQCVAQAKKDLEEKGYVTMGDVKRGDWVRLGWEKETQEAKVSRMLESPIPAGRIKEGDGEFSFTLTGRGAEGQRTAFRYALPTRELAETYLMDAQAQVLRGEVPTGVARKDWPLLGLTDRIEFNYGKKLKFGGRVLHLSYRGTSFRAWARDAEQEQQFNDMLVADIRKHGHITIPTVQKPVKGGA